jgi:hypothetical protein
MAWEAFGGRQAGDSLPLKKCESCEHYEFDKSAGDKKHQCWVETTDHNVASYALVQGKHPSDCSRYSKGARMSEKAKSGGGGFNWFKCICRVLCCPMNQVLGWRCYIDGKRI